MDMDIVNSQVLEALANGSIDPNNIKKDIRKYIKDMKDNPDVYGDLLGEGKMNHLNLILDSDDPLEFIFRTEHDYLFDTKGALRLEDYL
jgi:hypothetical protein